MIPERFFDGFLIAVTNPLTARLSLLSSLADDDIAAIEQACGSTVRFEPEVDVVVEGSSPTTLHIMIQGWAARYKRLSGGRRQITAFFLPGDVCDLEGLVLDRAHLGICALTPCAIALPPHADIRILMNARPQIRRAFWALSCVEQAISSEWMVGLGRRSALERMAHLLCELLLRLSNVDLADNRGFLLPISQAELADALGMSLVHVNRTLKELRVRGLISHERRFLAVLDLEALESLAGFNSGYLFMEKIARDRQR